MISKPPSIDENDLVVLHISQAGGGVIVRIGCEELSSKKWIVHANWLREGAIVGVLLLAYFTWGTAPQLPEGLQQGGDLGQSS